MIFTAAQVRAVRQGRMSATLVPRSERVRAGSVRVLRRCELTAALARRPAPRGRPGAVLAWIGARLDLDPAVEVVCDTTPDGERVPVLLTVLAIADVELDGVTLVHARACGWRTTGQLRAAWTLEHPQSPRARLVSFAVGARAIRAGRCSPSPSLSTGASRRGWRATRASATWRCRPGGRASRRR
ncbi:MAG: hypothetical protein ABSB73_09730 [Solirubrobacteraceae bacterium]